jgi:hypothetical protein
VKWTSTYYPQPINLLGVKPVLFCSTAPDFNHSLLLEVYGILPCTVPYLPLYRQYRIINKWLVILTSGNWNSRSFVRLKVGHRTLYKERNFLWRRSEQSGISAHVAIQTPALVQISKCNFRLHTLARNGPRTFIIMSQECGRTLYTNIITQIYFSVGPLIIQKYLESSVLFL